MTSSAVALEKSTTTGGWSVLRENSQEARANGRGTTLLYMHISLFQLSDF
jgi:hypothetical protein